MTQRTNYIFRIVGRGVKAEGFNDDNDETDLDGPCDLVALVEEEGKEKEVDRKEFNTGTEASSYLLGMVQGKKAEEEGETS